MTPLLEVTGLRCRFETPRGAVEAVRGVSLAVNEGETVGLVGESGCGKSTLARAIVGLERPVAGSIRLRGEELLTKQGMAPRHRRTVQFVFQDPFGSLNPRRTVETLIREPLDVHRIGTRAERAHRVAELMEQVGLRPEWAGRRPHEFSGGQRQRIGIARALVLRPSLLVCDEPVSALDVSVQAQVINLLDRLQRDLGVAYLFISHDLALVELFAHRVLVMYRGLIVEQGDSVEVWRSPAHPFTRRLKDSVPIPDPAAPHPVRVPPPAESRAAHRPDLCGFLPRCPNPAAICHDAPPPEHAVSAGHPGPSHHVLCHRALDLGDKHASAA